MDHRENLLTQAAQCYVNVRNTQDVLHTAQEKLRNAEEAVIRYGSDGAVTLDAPTVVPLDDSATVLVTRVGYRKFEYQKVEVIG